MLQLRDISLRFPTDEKDAKVSSVSFGATTQCETGFLQIIIALRSLIMLKLLYWRHLVRVH